ncbi:MAG TPA: hypothetical protein VFK42_01640 [Acidimicrobiales bacterium]|jgi:hypothetical protein|nr:hypothetical protein [Acidimicrobiales bacterium]
MEARAVLLDGGEVVASWPIEARDTDLALVDRLARARLTARRAGFALELRDVSVRLAELLDLVGLRVEMCGQPEHLEQPRVEEVVVPDDPAV